MSIQTFSSRAFNQDVSRVKQASKSGPVFITDRGKPAHVLLSIQDYQKMTGQACSIIDMLAMIDESTIDFEPAKMQANTFKSADFI